MRWTSSPSTRGAREGSPSTRRFARWVAAGVADLVERSCARARALADGLAELPGCEVLNDVVLNQVLIRFEDDATTDAVLGAVQESGEAWTSGTTRDGRKAIRLSVSNWQTSEDDVGARIAAFAAARAGLRVAGSGRATGETRSRSLRTPWPASSGPARGR